MMMGNPVVQQIVFADFLYVEGLMGQTLQELLIQECCFLKLKVCETVCSLDCKWWKIGHVAQVCSLLEG